jgi:hypothetical protein
VVGDAITLDGDTKQWIQLTDGDRDADADLEAGRHRCQIKSAT